MKKQKQLQVKLDPKRMKISDMLWSCTFQQIPLMSSIVGSVVEFSPATRETGVRFPDNAGFSNHPKMCIGSGFALVMYKDDQGWLANHVGDGMLILF